MFRDNWGQGDYIINLFECLSTRHHFGSTTVPSALGHPLFVFRRISSWAVAKYYWRAIRLPLFPPFCLRPIVDVTHSVLYVRGTIWKWDEIR